MLILAIPDILKGCGQAKKGIGIQYCPIPNAQVDSSPIC
jgi:hypothetical protein